MTTLGARRALSGIVVVEAVIVIVLLLFATCCPAALERLEAASDGAELVLYQPATDVGPDPFVSPTDRVAAGRTDEQIAITEDDEFGPVGTYGGTLENTCDPELLVEFLTEIEPARGRAWATAQGIAFDDIASFVAGLTPAVLTTDTAITNYGYSAGLTSNPSILAAGTAVLVDADGVPVVRCMCGNPIGGPVAPPPPVSTPPTTVPPPCSGRVEVFGFDGIEPTLLTVGTFDVDDLKPSPLAGDTFVYLQSIHVILPNGDEGLVDPAAWAELGPDCPIPEIVVCATADIVDDDENQNLLASSGTLISLELAIGMNPPPPQPLYWITNTVTGEVSDATYDLAAISPLIGSAWQCEDPPPPCESAVAVVALDGLVVTTQPLGQYVPSSIAPITVPAATTALITTGHVLVNTADGPGAVTADDLISSGCTVPPVVVCVETDVEDDGVGGVIWPGGSVLTLGPSQVQPAGQLSMFVLFDAADPTVTSPPFTLPGPHALTATPDECDGSDEEPECVVEPGSAVVDAPLVGAAQIAVFDPTWFGGGINIGALGNGFLEVSDGPTTGFVSLTDMSGLCLPIVEVCVEDGPVTLEQATPPGTQIGPSATIAIGPAVTQINGVPHYQVGFSGPPSGFLRFDVVRDPSACPTTTTTVAPPSTTVAPPSTTVAPPPATTTTTTTTTTTVAPPPTTSTTTTTTTTAPPAVCEFTNNMYEEPNSASGELVTSGGGWSPIQTTSTTETDPTTGRLMVLGTATVGGGATRTGWVFADSVRGPCEGI